MNITSCVKFLLLTLVAGFAEISYADFELGSRYYANKDYEKAYQEFREAAEWGDFDAQYNLAAMYYRGEAINKDPITAYAWFQLAAQAPVYAQQATGKKIFSHFSADEKAKATLKFEELNKLYSSDEIQKRLMPVFTGKKNDVRQRRRIKSISADYPPNMAHQGEIGFVDISYSIDKQGFTRDFVINQSPNAAFTRYAIAALKQWQFEPTKVNGTPVAVNGYRINMIFLLYGTKFSDQKINESVTAFKEKASKGSSYDKLNYAYFLEAIPKFSTTYIANDNPNQMYIDAAKSGNAAASFFLGINLLSGNMCEADSAQSTGWLLQAASQGLPEAQYMLAEESLNGIQFKKDNLKGIYWLEKSSQYSDIAKLRLSWILATSSDDKLLNTEKARNLLDAINTDKFLDDLNYFQTQAAVFAREKDYKKAQKWQKKAIDEADDLKLPLDSFNQKLDAYKNNKPWREDI